jgi:hypothetical protein
MKADSLNSHQHTLTTSVNGPHTDRIDRITTGSGSDNFQLKTAVNLLTNRHIAETEAAGLKKNSLGSDRVGHPDSKAPDVLVDAPVYRSILSENHKDASAGEAAVLL